jgi:general secretion pathway protein J
MRQARQAGFTLIEVTIALGILAFMVLTAWTTINGTARTKRTAESLQQRSHEIRIAMNRLVTDISSAYISSNQLQSVDDARTLFVGKESGEVDELRFSSLGHAALWSDANESEQTMISYSAEQDRDESSMTNLVRREQRRLTDEEWKSEPAEIDVLLRDIKKVHFEYWDVRDKEWKTRWDTTAPDTQRSRLPTRVKIVVELERGDETVKFTTQARISMQEELKFFAN